MHRKHGLRILLTSNFFYLDDTIIELYTSPEKAIERCVKNDSILIYSRSCHVASPFNIKEPVTIIGVGETISKYIHFLNIKR